MPVIKKKGYFSVVGREFWSGSFRRDVGAEALATFMLMSVQCALPLTWDPLDTGVHPRNAGGVVQTALGMGFIVNGMGCAVGQYGGAHMNPAVSIAFAACMRITFTRAMVYIVAQCTGAVAGAAFIKAVTPTEKHGSLAATVLGPGVQPWQGFLIELWISTLLILVVLIMSNARSTRKGLPATLTIGFIVACACLCGYTSTGASMNPARSLGPAVMMGIWENHWVYWSAPISGGLLACIIYFLFDKTCKDDDETRDYEISKGNCDAQDEASHLQTVQISYVMADAV